MQPRRKKDECYESLDGIRSRGDRPFLKWEGKTSKRFEPQYRHEKKKILRRNMNEGLKHLTGLWR